mgnify:CR=1 FL=1
MAQQIIKFKPVQADIPVSVGRNGTVKTTGIAIQPLGREVWIQPITSKGSTARCVVALPSDPDTLREMAAVLLMTAEELQAEQVQSAA